MRSVVQAGRFIALGMSIEPLGIYLATWIGLRGLIMLNPGAQFFASSPSYATTDEAGQIVLRFLNLPATTENSELLIGAFLLACAVAHIAGIVRDVREYTRTRRIVRPIRIVTGLILLVISVSTTIAFADANPSGGAVPAYGLMSAAWVLIVGRLWIRWRAGRS